MNRLGDATSPYLLQHADNPVDWWPWGADAFAEAARRDVPVFLSIGYATCHWCHVMARESFSDPIVAAYLNENFVAVKVDREEHPDVDASYLAAAGAFTRNLGWPLSIFATPEGLTFFAGTYFPPRPTQGSPEFLRVLGAITDAWTGSRGDVQAQATAVGEAIAAAASAVREASPLPSQEQLDAASAVLAGFEDREYGGFGTEPKFPVAPVLGFLVGSGGAAQELGIRTLKGLGASPLRDSVEGGFFRYATRRDWTDPHYERMLYDNALLLDAYTQAWRLTGQDWARLVADGIARFLTETMQLPGGGFASAQDSESTVDGRRSEGGYYRRDRDGRAQLTPPALDEKVLTGWNGLAIGALARAGFALDRSDWLTAARAAADTVLATHVQPDRLVRSSLNGRVSSAAATLEDYGMLSSGLLALATATGEVGYATAARRFVDDCLRAGDAAPSGVPFGVPGGADAVLAAHGLAFAVDTSEGAYPSGLTAIADAAYALHLLTGDVRYVEAARATSALVVDEALAGPMGHGAALALMRRLGDPIVQLVTVVPPASGGDATPGGDAGSAGGAALVAETRTRAASVAVVVTDAQAAAFAAAGFELFEARASRDGAAAAYLCRDFVCRLPVTDVDELDRT